VAEVVEDTVAADTAAVALRWGKSAEGVGGPVAARVRAEAPCIGHRRHTRPTDPRWGMLRAPTLALRAPAAVASVRPVAADPTLRDLRRDLAAVQADNARQYVLRRMSRLPRDLRFQRAELRAGGRILAIVPVE
jgi:hypothetical protein